MPTPRISLALARPSEAEGKEQLSFRDQTGRAYRATWAVMIAIVVGLLGWFRHRGWLGGESDRER